MVCRDRKYRADAQTLLAHPFVATERLGPQLGPLHVDVNDAEGEEGDEIPAYLPHDAAPVVRCLICRGCGRMPPVQGVDALSGSAALVASSWDPCTWTSLDADAEGDADPPICHMTPRQ